MRPIHFWLLVHSKAPGEVEGEVEAAPPGLLARVRTFFNSIVRGKNRDTEQKSINT